MECGLELSGVRALSDEALLLGLRHSLGASRRAVAAVVVHLGEVEERRLHLLGGYSSMFAYCVTLLGMSEDEAYRRIEVARLVRRFPLVLARLASGQLSLSVATLLKRHLTDANHDALLEAVSGKTVFQAREVLVHWFPQPDVLPGIRKLPARTEPAASNTGRGERASEPKAVAFEPTVSSRRMPPSALAGAPAPTSQGPARPPPPVAASRALEPLSPERYKLQLTASADLKRKLEQARDLLRHAVPSGDLATLVERALDALLEQTLKRRFAQRAPTRRSKSEPSARAATEPVEETSASKRTRHIPHDVRRAVFARDEARCTWQGPDGVRCESRAWLEHDHAIPWGLGGPSDVAHTRLYCRAHNGLSAELVYGQQTITRIIARRRARKHPPPASSPAPASANDCPAPT
jgi:hypothetical protein